MPAVMKKPAAKAKATLATKAPKTKLISKVGVTAVKAAPKTKHPYNPVKSNRGIVFIRHIPHGFYEEQLKSYFEQFGAVTRTRVARSEKTGGSKGYAFVEFRVPEVAKIAAETMDNYLMFKQVLKTAYIAPEEQKYNYFRQTVRKVAEADGTQRLVTPHTQRTARAVKKMNTMPTKKQHENRVERALYKLKKAQEQFAGKNIDVDLQQAVHGQADADATATKKLTKKQQKAALEERRIAKLAKLEAAKQAALANSSTSSEKSPVPALAAVAVPTSSKASAKGRGAAVNTTLDKLLNETIGESADDDSDDEDFNASIGANSTLNSTLNSTTTSASSDASSPPPAKKAKRNAQKATRTGSTTSATSTANESIASTASSVTDASVLSSPEPVRTKKSTSLVASGGVQKKRAAKKAKAPKVTTAVAVAVGSQKKSQKAAKKSDQLKELLQSNNSNVKKVKAAELKQKKSAGKRA